LWRGHSGIGISDDGRALLVVKRHKIEAGRPARNTLKEKRTEKRDARRNKHQVEKKRKSKD
jgi:hypothetical protein